MKRIHISWKKLNEVNVMLSPSSSPATNIIQFGRERLSWELELTKKSYQLISLGLLLIFMMNSIKIWGWKCEKVPNTLVLMYYCILRWLIQSRFWSTASSQRLLGIIGKDFSQDFEKNRSTWQVLRQVIKVPDLALDYRSELFYRNPW